MIDFQKLGYDAFKSNEYSNSILYFKIYASECKTNNFLNYYNISINYLKIKEYKNALDNIKISIKINPNWYKSWLLLGNILKELNLVDKASIAYHRCGELSYFTNELNQNIKELKINDNKSTFFNNFTNNPKILNKLNNDDIRKKILDNQYNPMIVFKDKDIQDIMKLMYQDYFKK